MKTILGIFSGWLFQQIPLSWHVGNHCVHVSNFHHHRCSGAVILPCMLHFLQERCDDQGGVQPECNEAEEMGQVCRMWMDGQRFRHGWESKPQPYTAYFCNFLASAQQRATLGVMWLPKNETRQQKCWSCICGVQCAKSWFYPAVSNDKLSRDIILMPHLETAICLGGKVR